jgi:prolyl oligopeptidase
MRNITLGLLALASLVAQATEVPETRAEGTVNTYHGTAVEDPYQWLEDWSSQEVKAWSTAQNIAAREMLDALPNRDQMSARIEQTLSDSDNYHSVQRVGGQAWFIKDAPPKQQPYIVQLNADGDLASERTVFDPEIFDESGSTSIQWFRISPDGKRAAIALTSAGSEIADLYVFDLDSGELIDAVVPRVNGPTAGGDLAWDPNSAGFYYTRYPRDGERTTEEQNFHQQLWHRILGLPLSEDTYEIGESFDRTAEIRIELHRDSGKVLATVQLGDGGRFEMHIRDDDGSWHQVAEYNDELVQATIIDQDSLLVLSRSDAPRGKFMRMEIGDLPKARMTLLVPESNRALASEFYSVRPFCVDAGSR